MILGRLREALRVARHVRHNLGLQSYLYVRGDVFPLGKYVRQKYDLVQKELATLAPGRSVLDLGSSDGFFTLLAARLGAVRSVGVEEDASCVARAQRVAAVVDLPGVEFRTGRFPDDRNEPHDIVLAFAILHWVFHYSYESLAWDDLLGKLAKIAREHLVVEFVEREDATFARNLNRRLRDDYRHELFLAALKRAFPTVRLLGEPERYGEGSTRFIYLASHVEAHPD